MKGNQGLDALAALCGGASKAPIPSQQPSSTTMVISSSSNEKVPVSIVPTPSTHANTYTAQSVPAPTAAAPKSILPATLNGAAQQQQQQQPRNVNAPSDVPHHLWQRVAPAAAQYTHLPTMAASAAAANAIIQAAAAQNGAATLQTTVATNGNNSLTPMPTYYQYAQTTVPNQAQSAQPVTTVGVGGKTATLIQASPTQVAYLTPHGVPVYSTMGQATAAQYAQTVGKLFRIIVLDYPEPERFFCFSLTRDTCRWKFFASHLRVMS